MRRTRYVLSAILFVLLVSPFATAQMGRGKGMGGPSINGVWKPVVGSGAAYLTDTKGEGKREMEITIVSAETSEGKPGYWMEQSFKDPKEGQMVIRTLVTSDGGQLRTLRMVMQQGNEEPIEISMDMMGMMGQQRKPEKSDIRKEAERVGKETITTPAGTFECEHWRLKDEPGDFWVSEKVSPWGLVKSTSLESDTTLVKVITNATTKIRGTPKKLDMNEMMRKRP